MWFWLHCDVINWCYVMMKQSCQQYREITNSTEWTVCNIHSWYYRNIVSSLPVSLNMCLYLCVCRCTEYMCMYVYLCILIWMWYLYICVCVCMYKSDNAIIHGLVKIGESDLRFTSAIWRHWYKLLYSNFW